MSKTNVYRNGKVHVCAEKCDTCIFRRDVSPVAPACVAQLVESATRKQGVIPCHHTIRPGSGRKKAEAVCKGFFDLQSTPQMQLALRLGMIEYVTPPPL